MRMGSEQDQNWKRHGEQGERIPAQSISIKKEYGKIAFEAKESGFYYVYYLPYNHFLSFIV